MRLPRLLVLTDRSRLPLGRGLLRTLRECHDAGLTHVVLRELDEPVEQRVALALELAGLGLTVIGAHTPLRGAIGLHQPAAQRGPVGAQVADLVGRSCHTRAEVEQAAADGCDYVTLGPWAPTASKPGYPVTLEPADFGHHAVPVFALGGITPANAREARDAGAHGVAVMGGVMAAAEPAAAVAALLEAVGG